MGIKGLPDSLPENIVENEKALKALHEILLETHIIQGELKCSKCNKKYPISNGILNMLIREDVFYIFKKKRKLKKMRKKRKKKMKKMRKMLIKLRLINN
jgi:uncharacterized protein YbaR (Trm112 family)